MKLTPDRFSVAKAQIERGRNLVKGEQEQQNEVKELLQISFRQAKPMSV